MATFLRRCDHPLCAVGVWSARQYCEVHERFLSIVGAVSAAPFVSVVEVHEVVDASVRDHGVTIVDDDFAGWRSVEAPVASIDT